MRTLFRMIAAAGALTPALVLAQTNVTVYGRLDLSVDSVRNDASTTGSLVQMVDNTSRLGFRGTEDLGGGLKAVFGAEFGFAADSGTFSSATNPFRCTFVGLTGDFGAFAMGRLDTCNPTGSPLYSQVTRNIDFTVHDAGAPAIGTKILNARNRVSNAIGYMSPTFGGLDVRARYYQQGPDTPNTAAGLGVVNEGDFKSVDLGLNYANGPFAGGIGYGQDRKRGTPQPANDFKNKWQAVASYSLPAVKAYAFYGRDNFGQTTAATRESVNYWLVGATVPLGGAHAVTANYMRRDVQTDRNGQIRKFQASYTYSLSKRTKLYALIDSEDPNSNKANDSINQVSVGIQHNF